eukprot:scaffold18451_cov73-Phaeocystis_antarctica.AAC.3
MSGRGLSHILQARRLEQHRLCFALHRHRVPPLGRVVVPRHAAPPVELRPCLEAADAHATAREVRRGGGDGGRRIGCVVLEQLGSGGVAFVHGQLQRRAAVTAAQLGAGARLQQLLHALRVALVSGHHQSGRPTSVLQVDARLVLEQQAYHGVVAHRRSQNESGAVHGAVQVNAGTVLQQLLRHAQAPTLRGCVQQPETPLDYRQQLAAVRGECDPVQLRGALPEQLGNGGVAIGLGYLQRRGAVTAAQLGAGARLQQLLHALLLTLAGSHHQGGRPTSVLQVDARLVLEQQAYHGILTHRRRHHESCATPGVAQFHAGTALQQLLRHAQAPTLRGRMQQPAPVLV